MALDPYKSDYVTRLRGIAARTQGVYFDTTALRRPAQIMGYADSLTPDDLGGANGDVTVDDVTNVNTFYDAIDGLLASHPEYLLSLLKLARGGQT
jgi:hypothetical protein